MSKQKNTKKSSMFSGIKNDYKLTKNSIKQSSSVVFSMIKDLPNLPWKKLPLIGWGYIIFSIIVFMFIIFFLMPKFNI